ncbi:NADPH-dependent F420 reductase [Burkholderia anthina]|uniref:NADPH-dependent F420 reductase n=1 Tax=Burkholderia anthina TaxID=179879 RepID=UPI00158E5182|nr:NADPH-dependent F420 reductase [Burkholderia anthina]
MQSRPTIAVLGGTGALGSGLAKRLAAAGYPVILGSRSPDKARDSARQLLAGNGAPPVEGDGNAAAAARADIVIVAVPFASHDATLDELRDVAAGKIIVDAVVPLVPPKVAQVQLPASGSAGQIADARLGDIARVVSAFHNIGAAKLQSGEPIGCDVLVCGNDPEARAAVIAMTEAIGMRGIDAGSIANSAAAEALTSVLIGINRRYKVDCAGIRITGIAAEAA